MLERETYHSGLPTNSFLTSSFSLEMEVESSLTGAEHEPPKMYSILNMQSSPLQKKGPFEKFMHNRIPFNSVGKIVSIKLKFV